MVDLAAEIQRVHDIGESVGRMGRGVPEMVDRDAKVVGFANVDFIVSDSIVNILFSVKHHRIHDFVCFVDRDDMGCHC